MIFAFVLTKWSFYCLIFISTIKVIGYVLVVVKHSMSYKDGYTETAFISTFDDCDIFA